MILKINFFPKTMSIKMCIIHLKYEIFYFLISTYCKLIIRIKFLKLMLVKCNVAKFYLEQCYFNKLNLFNFNKMPVVLKHC